MLPDQLKINRTYISQAILDHSRKNLRDYIKSNRINETMEMLTESKKSKMFSNDAIAERIIYLYLLINRLSKTSYTMKNILNFVIILYISISSVTTAQPRIDSLKNLLQNATGDEKIRLYDEMLKHLTTSNPDEAILQSQLMIKYADSVSNLKAKSTGIKWLGKNYENLGRYNESIKWWEEKVKIDEKLNNPKDVAYTRIALANCLQMTSVYDRAMEEFDKAEKIIVEINDERGLGFIYGNKGLVYSKLGLFTEAIDLYYKEMQSAEKISDSNSIAHSLNSIANVMTKLKNYPKAIANYLQSIEIYEKTGDNMNVVYSISNLGVVYNTLNEKQKAIELYHKGLALCEKSQINYGKALLQMNLGDLLVEMKQYDSAYYYLTESNKFFSNQNLLHPLCHNYKTLGGYFEQTGNYAKANEYYHKAFELAKQINAPDTYRDVAQKLSELFEKMQQPEKALAYYKIFKHYSDSLFNETNLRETTQLEERYHFEKEQQKTMLLHQAELSEKQTVIISIAIGLLMISLLLILLFIEYRRKNAAYRALYLKNMEMLKNQPGKKKKENLKNGDLFDEIERKLREEQLFKQKDLSRDTLADLLGTNREYVQQTIKDHAEKTVNDYISVWRMEEAMKLLSKPELHEGKTMLEISDEIGLSATSTTTFYTLFKKYTEMTPAQFKKQSKANL